MEIKKAGVEDVDALAELIKNENDPFLTHTYLKHWYWKNPFRSRSVICCIENKKILGMASTNNFRLNINGKDNLVAFPQKVLTAKEIRGKGYFGKLYFENEKDNIENENADCFLTFTNALSTNIFLNKFNYQQGLTPSVILLPTLPFTATPKGYKYKLCEAFDEDFLSQMQLLDQANSINKSTAYYLWRYHKLMNRGKFNYRILEIHQQEKKVGYIVLKKLIKKRVPLYYLADVITEHAIHIAPFIKLAKRFAFANGALGLIAIENDMCKVAFSSITLKLRQKNIFNFLVKGKTKDKTKLLSQTTFNFFFGDLDFV